MDKELALTITAALIPQIVTEKNPKEAAVEAVNLYYDVEDAIKTLKPPGPKSAGVKKYHRRPK